MKSITNLMTRNRAIVIGLLTLLTLILGYQAVKVTFNADFSTYLSQDDPGVRSWLLYGCREHR